MTYMEAHRHLMKYAIRPSVQRTAVMEYLMNHKTHPTVDEIFIKLHPIIPTLSKTTVYNTLNLFVRKGAIQILSIDERNARYDGDISRHAHACCRVCNKIIDVKDVIDEQYRRPAVPGFDIDTTEISYFGKCHDCKRH